MRKIIPIVLVADEFYLPYTSATVQSIIENSSLENDYKIYIIHSSELSSIALFKKVFEKYSHFTFDFIDTSNTMNQYDFKGKHIWSKSIWNKLLIPYLFNEYERIIYLDSDLILRCEISQLLDLDMKDFIISAVRSLINISINNFVQKEGKENLRKNVIDSVDFYTMAHLKNYFNYFNAGMLVFDINKFCNYMPKKDILDFAILEQDKSISCDQSIFNKYCEGKVNILHYKYNYEVENHWTKPEYLPKQMQEEYFAAKENPQIIHFLWKPWTRFFHVEFFYEFWKYATRTPFIDNIVQRMNDKKLIGYDTYQGI